MNMKMALASALLFVSGVASAQSSMSVNYAVQNDDSPAVQKHVTALKVRPRLTNFIVGVLVF